MSSFSSEMVHLEPLLVWRNSQQHETIQGEKTRLRKNFNISNAQYGPQRDKFLHLAIYQITCYILKLYVTVNQKNTTFFMSTVNMEISSGGGGVEYQIFREFAFIA